MSDSLSPEDLRKYAWHEVANLADIDRWAVRDEGERRQAAAEKRIESLKRQMAKAEQQRKDAREIILAAWAVSNRT